MSADQEIDALLSSLGYSLPPVRAKARAALEAANLTRPGKARISNDKVERVTALLRERFDSRVAVLASRPYDRCTTST